MPCVSRNLHDLSDKPPSLSLKQLLRAFVGLKTTRLGVLSFYNDFLAIVLIVSFHSIKKALSIKALLNGSEAILIKAAKLFSLHCYDLNQARRKHSGIGSLIMNEKRKPRGRVNQGSGDNLPHEILKFSFSKMQFGAFSDQRKKLTKFYDETCAYFKIFVMPHFFIQVFLRRVAVAGPPVIVNR